MSFYATPNQRVRVKPTARLWNGGTVCATPEGDLFVGALLDLGDTETFALFPLIEQPGGLFTVDLHRSTNNIEWIDWKPGCYRPRAFTRNWWNDREPGPITAA